jgi:hypothetical protein
LKKDLLKLKVNNKDKTFWEIPDKDTDMKLQF